MNVRTELRNPTVKEFQKLRASTDWGELPDELVRSALVNSLFSVCIMDDNDIIGMGRIVGDNALYFYVQDIIVMPDYKRKGIGKMIMNAIEHYIDNNVPQKAFIGLMAAMGVSQFYKQFGYNERLRNAPGMYKVKE